MQNFSKYFNLDTLDANQTLKPIIVITDSDDNVIFTFSQSQDELFNINGESIDIINCLNSVSNVKVSNDYDSKKLKINRLRCTLYNYYDVANKLSEYVNDGLINKNFYLFYKSPTTNIINLSDTPTDYDCAFGYLGSISRISVDDKSIKITAEDSTQYKISDKQVPYNSIDRISEDISQYTSSAYNTDDSVIPITFGLVDKAELFGTLSNGIMKLYIDTHPVEGIYKTSKIPSTLDDYEGGGFIYIKQGGEWIYRAVESSTEIFQSYPNVSFNVALLESNFIIPETLLGSYETYTTFKHHRVVESAYVFDGVGILDAVESTTEEASNDDYNIDSINDNGGNDKGAWYRDMDTIECNNENFDTGYGDSDRVIILRLSKGVGLPLAGTSKFKCDWKLYQENEQYTVGLGSHWPNEGGSPITLASKTGFWVVPISIDVYKYWQEFVSSLEDLGVESGSLNPKIFLGIIGLNNPSTFESWKTFAESLLEQIEEGEGTEVNFDDLLWNNVNDDSQAFAKSQIYFYQNEGERTSTGYWGNFAANNGITDPPTEEDFRGLYYGSGVQENENEDVHNTVAIFEPALTITPPYGGEAINVNQGLQINNFATEHPVVVDSVEEKKVYASVKGRRNFYFTEEIDATIDFSQNFMLEDVNFLEILLNGLDELAPETDLIFNAYYNTLAGYDTNFNYATEYLENLDDSMLIGNNHIFDTLVGDTVESTFRFIEILGADYYDLADSVWFFDENNPTALVSLDSIQEDFHLNSMMTENMIKSTLKKVLEFLLQRDIDYEENWTFDILTYPALQTEGILSGTLASEIQTINITDDVNSNLTFNWDSFADEIAEGDSLTFMQHFKTYIEDFKTALLTAMYNNIAHLVTEGDSDISVVDSVLAQTGSFDPNLPSSDFDAWLMNYLVTGGEDAIETTTSGSIEKPSDIIMNLLTTEMEFGKRFDNQQAGVDVVVPEYNNYDIDSIKESRDAHNNWKMGFCINKKQEGKKLIENILKESKSYPRFTTDGRFGFMTIKESYSYEDIDKIIDVNDITKYNFKQSKREDIITSCNMAYRIDYGTKQYTKNMHKNISDIFPEFATTGYDYYNLEQTDIDTHKDINLNYHTEIETVDNFMDYTLLDNCNVHNEVTLSLPLNYMDITVGDIINFSLIQDSKAFDIDYSVVDYLNGQPIYPLWIVMSTDIGSKGIKINAVQLHYLGTDGNHGFQFPEEETYQIVGNMQEFNSTYTFTNGNPIPNWNYNPLANVDSGVQIPYFDLNNDGIIDASDLIMVFNHVLGTQDLTETQKDKLKYNSNGIIDNTGVIDVVDITSIMNIIL